MQNESKGEVLTKIADGLVEQVTGMNMVSGTLGFLRDPKDPAPVVPPDLHLVRPVHADSDGNVTCIFCGRKVKYETAKMFGSSGFECGRCQKPQTNLPLETSVRRRVWPWLLMGAAVILGPLAGTWWYLATLKREASEARYPYVATAGDRAVLERNVDRWRDGKPALVAAVSALPALGSLKLGERCDVSIEGPPMREASPLLGTQLAEDIDELVADAERGRFASIYHRTAALTQIAAPVVVVSYSENAKAKLYDADSSYSAGHRAGTAYVFDASGKLQCATAFTARSSEKVKYSSYRFDETRRDMTLADVQSARLELESDLDANTRKAIESGLQRVE